MSNPRRKLSQAEEVDLVVQVNRHCPLCTECLYYQKRGKSYKEYDIAHIYPLNPNDDDKAELADVEKLSSDVNHVDNLIPLCTSCHSKFDKPRTKIEYERLLEIKKRLLASEQQYLLANEYPLDAEIKGLLTHLAEIKESQLNSTNDDFIVKKVDDKFDDTLPPPTRRKIKHAVSDYYIHIRNMLNELERGRPTVSELIRTQVRAFYLKQKSLLHDQQTIFQNVVAWIGKHAESDANEPAEIVASYFIQSCEVFE